MTEDRKKLVPKAANNPLPFAILGYLTIFAMFGMLGAWAALAHLDSAVVAVGQVAPESNRKEVQHYEGGIVSEIFVKEADVVKQGDLLMRLAGTQASANAETVQSQLDAAIALEARLTAERERADHITFPPEIESRRANPTTAKLIADQIAQFEERRQSLKSQRDILGSRVEQLEREIVGLRAVVDSTKGQIASLVTEIDKVKLLAKRGLFPQNRMHAMERDLLADQGRLGQTEAEIAKNEQAIGETRLQIIQIEQKFLEDVVEQLRDVRVQVAELTEKGRVAADILSRIEIRAPQSGTVQSLRFHTRGGVVRAGETIMEIVPLNDILNVHAHVSPLDVNHVGAGLQAEVRFPGFKSRTLPAILGHVRSISADSMMDEATRQPYYLAIVEVKDTEIPTEYRGKLTPGMPADIMIATGERTVIDYLVSPLLDAIRKTMREH